MERMRYDPCLNDPISRNASLGAFVAIPHRVIVIAGPSCVGKTRLISEMREGLHAPVRAALGLDDVHAWSYLNARGVVIRAMQPSRGLVLHYDIVRPLMERRVEGFGDDPGLAPMLSAAEVRVCSMWGGAALLRERAYRKLASRRWLDRRALRMPLQWWERLRRLRRRQVWYCDEAFIRNRYIRWFEFVDSLSNVSRHLILDAHDAGLGPVHFAQRRDVGMRSPDSATEASDTGSVD